MATGAERSQGAAGAVECRHHFPAGPLGTPAGATASESPAARRVWLQIRRWLRPPRILRPTRAGWLFFGIIFGVGFAALNTGNNLLYLVLSLMLSFLALSGVLSESALRGLRVRRRLPREIYAGADNSVVLEIHNGQRRVPAFAIAVEDLLGSSEDLRLRGRATEGAGRVFTLRVGPGESELRRYALHPAHRGTLRFAGFRASTRFPFGLFQKSRDFVDHDEALVYPELVRGRAAVPEAGLQEAGTEAATTVGQGGTVAGLREYEPGDPLRRIHWKSSLRRGALLVSQVEDERDAQVTVRLQGAGQSDGHAGDDAAHQRFEAGVVRAASQVVANLEAGRSVALRTDAAFLPARCGHHQRARLLSFLALVEPDGTVREAATP